MGILCLSFLFCNAVISVLSSFAITWLGKRELVAVMAFLLSCDCECSLSLPRGAIGWSVVCDCDIIHPANTQQQVTNGPQAIRHFNGVSLAGRCWLAGLSYKLPFFSRSCYIFFIDTRNTAYRKGNSSTIICN